MNTFNHQSGQYLETNGAKIYFEEIGNKNKPALLILHGGFESIENLNPMTSYLSNDFRIIGIDSRGHGKSTLGSKKLSYEQIQLDIEAVLLHLKINNISIIGFSDGGIVAYRIAASNKITVDKLVTMGASWSEKDVTDAEEKLKSITPKNAPKIFPAEYANYQQLNPNPDFNQFVTASVSMWIDKTQTGHPNQTVSNINATTLLIRGDNDFLVSLESLIELKKLIKNSSLMNVPFADHVVYKNPTIESVLKQFLVD